MRRIASVCLLLLLTDGAFGEIIGAKVQAVNLRQNQATISVLNRSKQDITGFSLAITATLADGRTVRSERTVDYGPLQTAAGKALHPGAIATETRMFSPDEIAVKVEAKLIVAIYRDLTAEVDSEDTFRHTLAVRSRIAKTLQLSADTLSASLTEATPSTHAHTRLEQLLREAKPAPGESDGGVDEGYLRGAIDLVQRAPQGSKDERDFIRQQAARLDSEASAFRAYAEVRRGQ